MRILMFNPFSQLAAIRQLGLARAMAKHGHDVTVVLPKYDKYSGYEDKEVIDDKINIIHPRQIKIKQMELSMLLYLPSALKQAMKNKYDVVHGFRPTPFSGYIGEKVAKYQKIPFILEIGDVEAEVMKGIKHPSYRVKVIEKIEKDLVNKAKGITTMSPNLADYISKKYNKQVKYIPSGINTKQFSPDICGTLKDIFKNNKQHVLMYVGKLDKSGHVLDMIEVLTEVKNVSLVVVGDGEGKISLIEFAKKLNVYDRCIFTGRATHEDIPKYLASADILIAPFSKDMVGAEFTLNLKVLEYMGMGKPIIISNQGILKDILKDCAFFYEPDDVKDFAKTIKYVLKNKKEVQKRITNTNKKVLEYDWNKLSKQMIKYYEEIIKNES